MPKLRHQVLLWSGQMLRILGFARADKAVMLVGGADLRQVRNVPDLMALEIAIQRLRGAYDAEVASSGQKGIAPPYPSRIQT